MIIKISCALRAKYQIGELVYVRPEAVVPHPLNRGGFAVTALRCRDITGDICTYGVDVTEAEQNAVLVEPPPDKAAAEEVRRLCCNPDFDAHFAEHAQEEEEMCL